MRISAVAIAASLTLASLSVAQEAKASIKSYQIEAQSVTSALKAFAAQSELQLIFDEDDVGAAATAGVNGEFVPREALATILQGTDLEYEITANNVVVVRKPLAAAPGAKGKEGTVAVEKEGDKSRGFWERARVAQGDGSSPEVKKDEGEPAQLDEIVVTAQKREERLQDVPISISVLDGAELDRSSAQSMNEVLSRVPGVTLDAMGSASGLGQGGAQIAIRGITASSSFNAGPSPIGYYLDSVPFGFVRSAMVPDPDIYDLERVEVLRGPQGTLYGAGGAGGVVRVISKGADLNHFEWKTRAVGSNTQDGGNNYRGDVAVNVPLIEGKLAARAVLGYQDMGGWIDRPTRADANDRVLRTVRIKLNGQPTDNLSVGLSGWLSRSDMGAPPLAEDDARTNPLADVEQTDADFDAYGLTVGYDSSAFSVSSTTSYLEYIQNGLGGDAVQNAPSPFPNTAPYIQQTILEPKIFSQEVNLASALEGPWRWTAGGIYREGEDRLFATLPNNFRFVQDITFTSRSWALFGELTRSFFNGKLDLTAGVRRFEDDVTTREEGRLSNFETLPAQFITTDRKFEATTPRVILTWKPQEQTMVYSSYSEGFRSGFDQLPSVLAGAPILPPVEPDNLKNFELGSKGSFLGGRIGYDIAVYYMDWQDVQFPVLVFVEEVARSAAINGSSASGAGVDFAMTATPVQGLDVGLNVSWNDLSADTDIVTAGGRYLSQGQRLPGSVELTSGVFADYSFSLGRRGLEGAFSISANSISKKSHVVDTGPIGGIVRRTGDSTVVSRISFAVNSPGRWGATLFVDNLNNERDATMRVPVQGRLSNTGSYLRPRTVGLQFEYRHN